MKELLKCEDVTLGYDRQPVASHVSFSVHEKDYLVVIGENGSGKSTLLKTLLGLIKPLSGRIAYDGLDRSAIGYLPQSTTIAKDFPASVMEIVMSGNAQRMGWHPFYSREDKVRATKNLERMGMLDMRNESFRELSGGQRQRVLLARALCAADQLLVLDEPVTGLDPQAAKEMYETVSKVNKEGMAVVMISHDLEAARAYASHVLMFDEEVRFMTRKEYLADVE